MKLIWKYDAADPSWGTLSTADGTRSIRVQTPPEFEVADDETLEFGDGDPFEKAKCLSFGMGFIAWTKEFTSGAVKWLEFFRAASQLKS